MVTMGFECCSLSSAYPAMKKELIHRALIRNFQAHIRRAFVHGDHSRLPGRATPLCPRPNLDIAL